MLRRSDIAEEVIQDVYLWLWEHRETLEVHGTIRSYLYGAVRNRALALLRHDRLEEQCATEFLAEGASPGEGEEVVPPDVALERAELAAALTRALETLSPRVRQVALLRWRDKLSRAEIATALGVAVPTVNNQLTAAARALRALLAEYRSESE